ncbi:BirA family transcriptional regulator, biotin operon repressor [Mariprofundus ferrinatatus]|uniref:Bifunctional ligase/repressor BirA n=1 Tax=Mariprofundus ferrinatatus TaxID=1921087 RepID=A0A2K8LC00_9PROT|nr:biotin--[acetyl-CoA-carboxylase] ligase [Mariprofundus ferrinatatus]ATX82424.1 BirA family transcriptional regulator, biotin operon repressor [Mariprofundus ferrinatatus]
MNAVREKILARLDASPEPVSGDMLAKELGLSRTGIWKHIEQLRKSGADIVAHSGQGYSLASEVFSSGVLAGRCNGKRIGRQILVLDETDSTNRDAMAEAEKGAEEGLVIISRRQRAGKGRLGRRWHTVADSLACSVLLRPDLPPEQVPQLSLLTSVALHDGLGDFAQDLRIKWPNDILHRNAKLAGILTEMRAEPGRVHSVVLGFGINLGAPVEGWPSDITQRATDLFTISGSRASRLDVAAAVINALDYWYDIYLEQGFAPVHAAWWRAHAASGQKVRVHNGKDYIDGIATALDQDGALLLKTIRGTERIIAGDLELR